MGQSSNEEVAARLRETEQLLLQLRRPKEVIREMMKRHQVSQRCVETWISKVRKRWREEAGEETRADIDAHRAESRQQLLQASAAAWSRTEIVRDSAGNPVLDPKTGKPLRMPKPDLRAVVQIEKRMAELMGLDRRQVQQVAAVVASASDMTPEESLAYLKTFAGKKETP